MLDFVRHLFTRNAPPETRTPAQRWRGSGLYPLKAVGTSYRRAAIAEIAGNPPGQPALLFCTARLVPDDNNPHDTHAVAVMIGPKHVAFLPRTVAATYRRALDTHQMTGMEITCAAVVHGGLVTGAEAFEYSIELDVDPSFADPPAAADDIYLADRHSSRARTSLHPDGSYTASAWLSLDELSNLRAGCDIEQYSKDGWDTVNYYLSNQQRIGWGDKILAVPKTEFQQLFDTGAADLSVDAIDGRLVTFRLTKAAAE